MRTSSRPDRPAVPAEQSDFGVRAALGLAGTAGPVEVHVDVEPVSVRARGGWGLAETWTVAGPLRRRRVLAGVGPLLAAGGQLDGTFAAAARWDVSVASGPDLYRGCWVRMRRDAPPAADEPPAP